MEVTENDVRLIKWCSGASAYNARYSQQLIEAVWSIHEALAPLAPRQDKPFLRSIWVPVSRGRIEDWCYFEDFRNDWERESLKGEPSEQEWREEWSRIYPDEEMWHEISISSDEGWLTLLVDGRVCIQINPGVEPSQWEDESLGNALDNLASSAAAMVEKVRDGSYAQLLDARLPYRHRFGFIKRKLFWSITGDEGRRLGGKMDKEEAATLSELLSEQRDEGDVGELDELSMAQYFNALKEAYESAGFENDMDSWRGFQEDDPRAWYCRFGDARDDQLFDIDQESPVAMRDLFLSKPSFNHGFEALAGRGCTRVYITPVLSGSTGRWHLSMHGRFDGYADAVARMWNSLNEQGMPTHLHNADALRDILLGNDWVMIAPEFVYADYLSGRIEFGRRVGIAVHLWEEYADDLVRNVEWMPLDLPEIAHE